MFGLELDPAVWALIGTIIASVGVKFVERWLSSKDRVRSDAAVIRSELREQVTSYKEEIRRLEDEVDEWRGKYYTAMEELVTKRIELARALDQIAALTEEAKKRAEQVANQIKAGLPSEQTNP